MYKINRPAKSTLKPSNRGTPLIVLIALVGGAFLFYIIGFLALLNQHPIHWGLSIVGGVVGWLIGKLIYRLRGETDII